MFFGRLLSLKARAPPWCFPPIILSCISLRNHTRVTWILQGYDSHWWCKCIWEVVASGWGVKLPWFLPWCCCLLASFCTKLLASFAANYPSLLPLSTPPPPTLLLVCQRCRCYSVNFNAYTTAATCWRQRYLSMPPLPVDAAATCQCRRYLSTPLLPLLYPSPAMTLPLCCCLRHSQRRRHHHNAATTTTTMLPPPRQWRCATTTMLRHFCRALNSLTISNNDTYF